MMRIAQNRLRGCAQAVRLTLTAMLLGTFGCSSVNLPLNRSDVPLENRRLNSTRAGSFAPASLSTTPAIEQPRDVGLATEPTTSIDDPRNDPRHCNGWFVGVALSGGGSRSANFAAACMFQLERIGILQHVDYLSTVSGGSLAGAYYCISGDKTWNPGNVQRKLAHPFASDLIGQVLQPWNLFAYAFTDYDRTDSLAKIFEHELFSNGARTLTFNDLRADRPHLLINATDLQSGRRFVFNNAAFDDINSDLSRYPIGYAVAASSAVPVVLHPVTLRDYSTVFGQYRHLIDGGVADNLGVQTLAETYTSQIADALQHGKPDPYSNGAVIIVIDAHTSYNAKLSSQSDIGTFSSLAAAVGLTSTQLLNRASSATLADLIVANSPADANAEQLRNAIKAIQETGYVKLADRRGHTVHVVYLTLSQVSQLGDDVPFQSFGESLNDIGTDFNIEPTAAFRLYQAAELLVTHKFEPTLRDILSSMKGEKRPVTMPAGALPAGLPTGITTAPTTAPVIGATTLPAVTRP